MYVSNLQLQEGMDTRKDGSVRTRNSIKWSTPNVEEHGEINDLKYIVWIHKYLIKVNKKLKKKRCLDISSTVS